MFSTSMALVLLILGVVGVTVISLLVGSFAGIQRWFEVPLQVVLLVAGGGLLYFILR